MLLYHGSLSDFDSFKIKKEFQRTKDDYLVEGQGIYLSESKEFSKGYGHLIYTVEVNENDIWDFTNPTVIEKILTEISKTIKFDLLDYIDFESISSGVLNGNVSVVKFDREIRLHLDASENFYVSYKGDFENLFEKISHEYKKILNRKLLIKYYDCGFDASVYICNHDEEKLRIIKKESI